MDLQSACKEILQQFPRFIVDVGEVVDDKISQLASKTADTDTIYAN
jgi:hypothetical protein